MTTKHTPGPHKANNGYTIIRDGVRHFPIHAKKRGMIGMALREGDAILWAAAPDLLEALKRCKFDSLNMSLADLDFCRAAYLKATGESL